jgi:hypothetical protein
MTSKFRYPTTYAFGVGVLPLAAVVGMPVVILDALEHRLFVTGLLIALLYLAVLLVAPSLISSVVTVSLDDRGIATYFLGFRTQRYAWSEVRRIVKTISIPNISPPNEFVEVIVRERSPYNLIFNAFGTIKVNELLCEYAKFRAKLNDCARENGVSLRVVDERAARSEPTPQARRLAMRDGTSVERI